ncbi:MAG: HypC/HybG/HupF family hydrogenase formation chaperone [Clostridia bacterium]|nr:HypC/HybG/HupF family hydrogenase formation chaperone [Clostridia bacterium]
MCVAMPGRVLTVENGIARVEFDGNIIEARADLTRVAPGDRVLVHAGLIIQKLSATEAEEMDAIFADLREIMEKPDEDR